MQQSELERMVQAVSLELRVESARLDSRQTLEVVLCRDFICFRPLQIFAHEVDVVAALAGESESHQALQTHLHTLLQSLI